MTCVTGQCLSIFSAHWVLELRNIVVTSTVRRVYQEAVVSVLQPKTKVNGFDYLLI